MKGLIAITIGLNLLFLLTDAFPKHKSQKKHHFENSTAVHANSEKRTPVAPILIGLSSLTMGLTNFGFGRKGDVNAAELRRKIEQNHQEIKDLLQDVKEVLDSKIDLGRYESIYSDSIQLCITYIGYSKSRLLEKCDSKDCNVKKIAKSVTDAGGDGANHILNNINRMIIGGSGGSAEKSIFTIFAKALDQKQGDYVLKLIEYVAYILKIQQGCYEAWRLANNVMGDDLWDPEGKYEERRCKQNEVIKEVLGNVQPYVWRVTYNAAEETRENVFKPWSISHQKDGKGQYRKICALTMSNGNDYAGSMWGNECRTSNDETCWFNECSKEETAMKLLYNRCLPTEIKMKQGINGDALTTIKLDDGSKPCEAKGWLEKYTINYGTVLEGKCHGKYDKTESPTQRNNPDGSLNETDFNLLQLECNVLDIYTEKHGALPTVEDDEKCPTQS